MKNFAMKNKKGFTLIEILIVVVILAVLAALIIPKFLGQSENALIAEANMVIGAMSRGQQAYMQLTGSSTGYAFSGGSESDWNVLGMSAPSSTNFEYSTGESGGLNYVQAKRTIDGVDSYITLDYITNTWEICNGKYRTLPDGKGCGMA